MLSAVYCHWQKPTSSIWMKRPMPFNEYRYCIDMVHIGHHWYKYIFHSEDVRLRWCAILRSGTDLKSLNRTTKKKKTKNGNHCLQMKRTKFDSQSDDITTVKNHRLNDFHFRVNNLNNKQQFHSSRKDGQWPNVMNNGKLSNINYSRVAYCWWLMMKLAQSDGNVTIWCTPKRKGLAIVWRHSCQLNRSKF